MADPIESWISTLHLALPNAEFVSLEPDDAANALLAAYWLDKDLKRYRILTYANQLYRKPDFLLEMEATSPEEAAEWALAALQFSDDHRHLTDLVPGALFAKTTPLVDFSTLDAWVVGLAVPPITPGVDLPLLSLYTIYKEEVEVCKTVGLGPFLRKAGALIYQPDRLAIQ